MTVGKPTTRRDIMRRSKLAAVAASMLAAVLMLTACDTDGTTATDGDVVTTVGIVETTAGG
jgi:hypothetical protein